MILFEKIVFKNKKMDDGPTNLKLIRKFKENQL